MCCAVSVIVCRSGRVRECSSTQAAGGDDSEKARGSKQGKEDLSSVRFGDERKGTHHHGGGGSLIDRSRPISPLAYV